MVEVENLLVVAMIGGATLSVCICFICCCCLRDANRRTKMRDVDKHPGLQTFDGVKPLQLTSMSYVAPSKRLDLHTFHKPGNNAQRTFEKATANCEEAPADDSLARTLGRLAHSPGEDTVITPRRTPRDRAPSKESSRTPRGGRKVSKENVTASQVKSQPSAKDKTPDPKAVAPIASHNSSSTASAVGHALADVPVLQPGAPISERPKYQAGNWQGKPKENPQPYNQNSRGMASSSSRAATNANDSKSFQGDSKDVTKLAAEPLKDAVTSNGKSGTAPDLERDVKECSSGGSQNLNLPQAQIDAALMNLREPNTSEGPDHLGSQIQEVRPPDPAQNSSSGASKRSRERAANIIADAEAEAAELRTVTSRSAAAAARDLKFEGLDAELADLETGEAAMSLVTSTPGLPQSAIPLAKQEQEKRRSKPTETKEINVRKSTRSRPQQKSVQ